MHSSIAAWDNEYARLARAASLQRTAGMPGNVKSPERNRALSQGLSRLHASLATLPLSANELERRKRLVQHLQQPPSLVLDSTMSAPNNNNNNAAGAAGYQPPQSQMAMAMQQQDEMLNELSAGMGRIKDQSQMISEEANLHNHLLNDMEGNLDQAHASLDNETRRAGQLRQDQSLWRLQLTVAGLFILFILLILIGLS